MVLQKYNLNEILDVIFIILGSTLQITSNYQFI